MLKKNRFLAMLIISIIAACMAMPFMAFADNDSKDGQEAAEVQTEEAVAEEEAVDLTDNDNAIEFLTGNKMFDAETLSEDEQAEYVTAAETFIGNYSDNVGGEGFDENLDKALTAKRSQVKFYSSWWALLPAIIAILLALITKEVYSSLFIGILSGALLYANFSWMGTTDHLFADGFISAVADSYNIGIIIFLIILGSIVALMNKSGGSAAFGRWAEKHIKTRVGAQLATVALGVLIFIDDYFNCLTVGSVMRPVTDKFKISRSKLSYIIDATAAPVCIIAPVSSWAAAVAGFVDEDQISGMHLFIRAIPYNFYAILTIVMLIFIAIMKFDFGPMKKHERNAANGDLFSEKGKQILAEAEEKGENKNGSVWDLVAPVIVLITACVFGLIYSGGFFSAGEDCYLDFIGAFSNADASVGLVIGSFIGFVFAVLYFLLRRTVKFKECMDAIPEGFKAMVPAILILAFAWTLKAMTDSLGAKVFIAEFVRLQASSIIILLPAIVFLIGLGLSFSTGTSWGTFGILIPIVLAVFGGSISQEICIIAISACMAGAVCGDHCSPISDTTIMASAGAQSNHINHVSTQLPYALTVAGVSFVSYVIAGFIQNAWIVLPISIVLMIGTLFVIKAMTNKKEA